ncbi:hypothetical protein KAI92_00395 [Candidatus Parcubacteria bacterium]|nr:hypothetical protein [Candidatus Parcubacteria bacterium]
MVKIVLHCASSEGKNDRYYGNCGLLFSEYKKMADEEVVLKGFGGFLGGKKKENFLQECIDADIVILDAWNYPNDWKYPNLSLSESGKTSPEKSMAEIAKEIKKINPFAHLFADLMEGSYEVNVHRYATPIKSWTDEIIKSAFKAVKIRNELKEKGESMKKLLVVDDNRYNLRMAQKQLAGDYDLITAKNFSEARDVIQDNKIDILMTDVMMPGERAGQTPESIRFYVDDYVPIGLVVALLALKNEIPEIYIVSDTNHHDHPMAWALDSISGNWRIKCFCGYACKMIEDDDRDVKDWKTMLGK